MPSQFRQDTRVEVGGLRGSIRQTAAPARSEARGQVIIQGTIQQTAPAATQQARGFVSIALDLIKADLDWWRPNWLPFSIMLLVSVGNPAVQVYVEPGLDTLLGLAFGVFGLICGFFAFPAVIKAKK